MPSVLLQNAYNGMVNRCRGCQLKCCWVFLLQVIMLIIDPLSLNLVYICLNDMLKILYVKSYHALQEIGNIDYSKIAKIWLVKFCK